MKNRLKIYSIGCLALLFLSGCYGDKGKYEYSEINEITITNMESEYNVMRNLDVLHIEPEVVSTIEKEGSENYSYSWEVWDQPGLTYFGVIGTEKNLNYDVTLDRGRYALYFKIMDNKTGVQWKKFTIMNIVYSTSRGISVTSNDKEGYAQFDMIRMPLGRDTTILYDLFKDAELPKIKGAKSFVYTGTSSFKTKMFVMGEDGSYFADSDTFEINPNLNISNQIFSVRPLPADLCLTEVAPVTYMNNNGNSYGGNNRVIRCNNGWILKTSSFDDGLYGEPMNYVPRESTELVNTAPYLMYPLGSFQNVVVFYDTDNDRFLRASGTSSLAYADKPTDSFPWNNKEIGLSLVYAENTRNTDGGSNNGNSFAIMRNEAKDDIRIYKFYVQATPQKRDAYTIYPDIATDFNNSSHFAFSSTRTVLLYAAGSKLYAYDYSKGNERCYELNISGGDEITMIKFDVQMGRDNYNKLYVATYNSATGGKLMRFEINTDVNTVELKKSDEWSGEFGRIVNVDWRS